MSDSLSASINHAFRTNCKYYIVEANGIEAVLEIPPQIEGADTYTRVMNFAHSQGWSAEFGQYTVGPGKHGDGWKFLVADKVAEF